jgi:hypothetical protein
MWPRFASVVDANLPISCYSRGTLLPLVGVADIASNFWLKSEIEALLAMQEKTLKSDGDRSSYFPAFASSAIAVALLSIGLHL